MDERETNVAVDERPMVRPLTGNQQRPLDEEWDDEEEADDEDDLEDGDGALPIEDEAVSEAGVEEDEDDGFGDERDPFVDAPAAENDELLHEVGEHVSQARPPVTLDGAVFARIAECLRAAMAEADEKLAHARDLAAREPFYNGFVTVLEAQRRRYTRALERVTAQAAAVAAAPVEPSAADPAESAELAEAPSEEPAELV